MISEATQRSINVALQIQDFDRAGVIAETALAGGESHAMIYSLAAFRRQQAGDTRGAVELYLRAAELAPDDPNILAAAGDALRYTGQLQQAVALFDRALAGDPMMIGAWYGRALALDASGAIEDAKRSYRRVAELAPSSAAGFAGLASMQAVLGEVADAHDNAERAQALAPNDSATIMALARCEITSGRHDKSAERLSQLVDRPGVAPMDVVLALGLLGDSLDRMGEFDNAFETYTRANERFGEIHAGPNAPPVARRLVEAIDEAVSELDPAALSRPVAHVPKEASNHIFLLGYPRSGTTLTEQILATAPGVVTLEESPTLAAGAKYLSADGIIALAEISDEEAARLRADYWARVAAADVHASDHTFVDMDPFKGPALPLIARLFPNAKVIVVRRDPRDVVWSCFRHNFVYSQVAYEFTSLARAARHYSATMRLIQRCIETLPLTSHTLHYEDLVGDFDQATRDLCAFAGLPWSPALRDFGTTARARSVKTASAPQVRGLLFDGSGRWRNYADKLQPVFPMLRRWVRSASPGQRSTVEEKAGSCS